MAYDMIIKNGKGSTVPDYRAFMATSPSTAAVFEIGR